MITEDETARGVATDQSLDYQARSYGGADAYSKLMQETQMYKSECKHIYKVAYYLDHTFAPTEKTYIKVPFVCLTLVAPTKQLSNKC